MPEYTTAELLCCVIARTLRDGRVFAQGIATPLVSAGYQLALRTRTPNSLISYTVGNSVGVRRAPLRLSGFEDLTLGGALARWSFPEVVSELLPSLPITEWFRPAQVDPRGQFNNVAIGEWRRPALRLPGCGGIADVTTYFDDFSLYVPRHSARVFVQHVDFVSGLGLPAAAPGEGSPHAGGPGPRRVVTDLCVMVPRDGRLALESLHPGVALEEVQRETAFPLPAPEEIPVTEPPTGEELRLLRTEIDPLGVRDLEVLPQAERRQRLRRILAAERTE